MLRETTTLTTRAGSPLPFGTLFQEDGVNFSLFSKNATSVRLALYHENEIEPFEEITFDPLVNKTGDIWHIFITPLEEGIQYCYFIGGSHQPTKGLLFDPKTPLIDPYAKQLSNETTFGKKDPFIRAVLSNKKSFDWKNDRHPLHPLQEMIIYETHVRGFTRDPSSNTENPGTFLGIIEKIPYLKSLGINVIELLPVHSFNECEFCGTNPITQEPLYNYWGYSTLNFFSLMNRYARDKHLVIQEFKTMVAALHAEGIEVILDVVYNHTAEGNELGPTLSFKGFENSIYYMLTPSGDYYNFSGCGNTFNCNHPVARELIRTNLRYWVSEMHIDGFRFDLASILGRGADGSPLSSPPLLEMIALDPILGKTKLIAEAWDAGGLYQVGSFPSWGVWAEWNGKFRDAVRSFIKGSDDKAGEFATRLCGSPDLYASGRTPAHSINFITAHDGFTLKDLVSYNEKHNEENGEENRDGTNENGSWNCGVEGEGDDPEILALRNRQMRNFMLALFVSQGVPMLTMGDEAGFTKRGNNNTWCHDNALNWFAWSKERFDGQLFEFTSQLIKFRKKHRLLRQNHFLTEEDIAWHGILPNEPDWSSTSRLVAFTLFDKTYENDLFIAFNANYNETKIELPHPPQGKEWHAIVDTSNKYPDDFSNPTTAKPLQRFSYALMPYSSILLKAL